MIKKQEKVDNETLSELATRKRIIADAIRRFGAGGERQMRMVFDKYDKLLAKCTNDSERKHIKSLAIVEIHQLMGYRGGLTINKHVVLPSEDQSNSTIIK